MSFWDAIDNLFRGPRATADGLPFADLRQSPSTPRESYAAVADMLPSFELGKAKWPTSNIARFDGEVYQKMALVFRCLSLISHAAGTAKVRVYDEANDDEEIADHPMRRLIRQPNARMGEARFWGTVALRAGVAGFCVVEKERDGFGDVIALNPLRSSWLKAIPMGRGVYDWEYRIPGNTTTLKAEDVIVFTWADTPDGSPYGLPPLATVVRDVAILDKLTQFLGNLLDRGGVPIWMLFPKTLPGQKLDQEKIDAMEQRFARRRSGFEQRGFPWIAEGFDKAERLSYDVEELAMTAIRDLSDLAICQAFGVPPRKAGVRIGLEHTTQNATASVEDGEFYRDTIVPLWTRLDDALTTGLLPDFEPPDSSVSLEFDTDDVEALQEDRNAKAQALVVPGFTGGLLSNHMALRELGMQVPEGLPEYYLRGIATEAIPADDPLQLAMPATTTTPPPPAGEPGDDGNLAAILRAAALIRDTRPTKLPDHLLLMPDGTMRWPPSYEAYVKRKAIGASNKKLIASVSDAREPSIKRFLKAQATRVAAALTSPAGVIGFGVFAGTRMDFRGMDAQSLANVQKVKRGVVHDGWSQALYSVAEIDWSYENDQLERVLRQLYQLAGSTAFDAAADQLGIGLDFDLANPRIADVLDRLALRVVDITQFTRDTIAQLVSDGLTAGKTITAIADEIKASTAFNAARATRIARTESMLSFGHASALAYKESGIVDRIQCWDNESHTDDYGAEDGLSCSARNGLIDTLESAELHLNSEHPNGSLAISPVLTGED